MSLIWHKGQWYLASYRPRSRSPSSRNRNFKRKQRYDRVQEERNKILSEAFTDLGYTLDPDQHPYAVPQKGEKVARTESSMLSVKSGDVLIRKHGPKIIYKHPTFWRG